MTEEFARERWERRDLEQETGQIQQPIADLWTIRKSWWNLRQWWKKMQNRPFFPIFGRR